MTHHKRDSHYHPHGYDKNREFGTQKHTLTVISQGQREHMIREAAYYLAEHRQFQGSDPIRDWFQAQSEIDNKIKSASH